MQPDREKSTLSDLGGARDLAMARLERAKEELASAQFNYENKQYFVANNRAYYAIYRAMCACLALEFKAFKKHGQTIGAFNKDFIHVGIFPADLGRRLPGHRKSAMQVTTMTSTSYPFRIPRNNLPLLANWFPWWKST